VRDSADRSRQSGNQKQDSPDAKLTVPAEQPKELGRSGKQKHDSPYAPLTTESRAFRLIRIAKGANGDLISCTFSHHQLSNCPQFVAISYTWGPCEPLATILIDGTPMQIRQNLWVVLSTLRVGYTSAGKLPIDYFGQTLDLFWIDAICIDQGNISERNHQVNLMKDIYVQATEVWVWLGAAEVEDQDKYDHVLDIIREQSRSGNATTVVEQLSEPDFVEGLLNLYHRPYWSRVWIVQEVLFAREVMVIAGHNWCSWNDLEKHFSFLDLFSHSIEDKVVQKSALDPILTSPARRLFANKNEWTTRKLNQARRGEQIVGYPLHKLIFMWPDQECEDVRDRVFGMLGLMDPESAVALAADYSKSVFEVFEDILEYTEQFYKYAPYSSKLGFVNSLATMLRISQTADLDRAIDEFVGPSSPTDGVYGAVFA
jgi:hypothetical protein